jgi:hypothetical protein
LKYARRVSSRRPFLIFFFFSPLKSSRKKNWFLSHFLYIHPFFPSYSFSNAPGPPMEQPRATGGKKMARGALRLFSSTFFSLSPTTTTTKKVAQPHSTPPRTTEMT